MPIGILYGIAIFIRNKLYNAGWSGSLKFSIPIINVGNLSVGGTGKSPHVMYLLELLKYDYQLATLSRGYRRRTKGFILADENSTAWQIGDEPMQYKMRHNCVEVCVGEDRIMAVPSLLQKRPGVQAILLDDAFQHRSIQPSLNILVTDLYNLYCHDYILPFGGLREYRSGTARADIIIVSKCNAKLSLQELQEKTKDIKLLPHQHIFFTSIKYDEPYSLFTKEKISIAGKKAIMVSGIANPAPMLNHLKEQCASVHTLKYADHHYFTTDDIEEIAAAYKNLEGNDNVIVTTEKDATRLYLQQEKIIEHQLNIVVLPIQVEFLHKQAHDFNSIIHQHLEGFYPKLEQLQEEPLH